MKYQHLVTVADGTFRIDPAQCMMTRARDVLAGVFVRSTDINQYRALTYKLSGASGRDGLQISHDIFSFFDLACRSGAVDVLEQRKQTCRAWIGDMVENRLRFAPRGDEAISAHLGKMLRQRRLA